MFCSILAYVILLKVINWTSFIINSLWIAGLAILLAGFSYHYWQAQLQKQNLKAQLNQSSFLKVFWLGFAFITAGLAGSSQHAWETAVWFIMGAVSLLNLVKISKQF